MAPNIWSTHQGVYTNWLYSEAVITPTPITLLKQQREPDVKKTPKKPKPVTDVQLLAIVEELEKKIAAQAKAIELLNGRVEAQAAKHTKYAKLGPLGRMFSNDWAVLGFAE